MIWVFDLNSGSLGGNEIHAKDPDNYSAHWQGSLKQLYMWNHLVESFNHILFAKFYCFHRGDRWCDFESAYGLPMGGAHLTWWMVDQPLRCIFIALVPTCWTQSSIRSIIAHAKAKVFPQLLPARAARTMLPRPLGIGKAPSLDKSPVQQVNKHTHSFPWVSTCILLS